MPHRRLVCGFVVCSASVLATAGCSSQAGQVPAPQEVAAPAAEEAEEEPTWMEEGP
ncbi:MAG: hypothetical protein MUF48_09975 [Pirellulaceae bacterium]|jgi:hypothetical protein|nr:hypothetical protein [Pirellulaceae bacterium]